MASRSQARAQASTTTADDEAAVTLLEGEWRGEASLPSAAAIVAQFEGCRRSRWHWQAADNFSWDSRLLARLLPIARYCHAHDIQLDLSALPVSIGQLLALATAVPPIPASHNPPQTRWRDHISGIRHTVTTGFREAFEFVGLCTLSLGRLATGRADIRRGDITYFMAQCGPQAIAIVALISVLVGMILAYLGSVQLRQFGAEIYVADLVTIGMVREMGALMTAVIMAGRTGASYAAQLGAMQANEEVDAITTLGIAPVDYLVLPRMIALVVIMPLLSIFSIALGLGGGALVAAGMDISLLQFINQARDAAELQDLAGGLFKSLIFGLLIAAAGCQAGLQSGRSSAAVGQATTRAVVHAIVYLVIADATLNILYDKLGI